MIGRPFAVALLAGLLTLWAAESLFAQSRVVRGRVVRADGPVGIHDAAVVVLPSGMTTQTDVSGHFTFSGLAPGPVEIVARHPRFVPGSVSLRPGSSASDLVEIRLESVAAVLDPVVISATRDPTTLGDVAGAVSVIDSAAVHRDRTLGLHEPLRLVPGVQVASRYGTDDVNIGIRGSAARGRQAVRGVAVLLDGVPLTEPDGLTRPDLIELGVARQVEIIRGPASAIHAGSPGGVVNLVTLSGRESRGATAGVQVGSFGLRKYEGRAGALIAEGRGSGLLNLSLTSTDGHRAHSDAETTRGHAAVDYMIGEGTRVMVQASGSRLDSSLPGSLDQPQLEADPGGAAPSALAFGFGRVDRRFRVGSRLGHAVGGSVLESYVFYGGRTLEFPIPSEIVDLDLRRVQGGARARVGGLAQLPIDLTIGLDFDRVFGTDQRWENNGGLPGPIHDDGTVSMAGLGAYGQAEWRVSSRLRTTVGVRHDGVTYRFQSHTAGSVPRQRVRYAQASPRFAAVWRPDGATSVYGSIGRGVEVPVIGELSSSPGDPLRSVRQKSLWNYELGVRRIVDDRVLVEGAVFLASVRGEFVPTSVDGVVLPENASRSRNVGLELAARALTTPWLELGAGYTLLDLRLLDFTSSRPDPQGTLRDVDFAGKQLPGVPRHRLTTDAELRPLDALRMGIQVEWQSLVYVETSNAKRGTWLVVGPGGTAQQVPFHAAPSRTLVHLSAAFSIGRATLFGNIENLLARRYTGNVVANEFFGRFYEPGSPFWISVGLRLEGLGRGS